MCCRERALRRGSPQQAFAAAHLGHGGGICRVQGCKCKECARTPDRSAEQYLSRRRPLPDLVYVNITSLGSSKAPERPKQARTATKAKVTTDRMSNALRIAHGAFGRVALLGIDTSLVRHAHPHPHVLLKVDGNDTQFAVGSNMVPLTDRQAVLIDAWEPHAYVPATGKSAHGSPRALYRAAMAQELSADWASPAAPPNSRTASRRCLAARPRPRHGACGADGGAGRPSGPLERLLSDLMIAVIKHLPRHGARCRPPCRRWAEQPAAVRDWRIRRAVNLIACETAHRSQHPCAWPSGLSRASGLLERSTQMTPHVYVNLLRSGTRRVDGHGAACRSSAAIVQFTRFLRNNAGWPKRVPPSLAHGFKRRGLDA